MNAPAGSKEHEGGTRLLVGALLAAGLMLALFIAFVVPNLIEDEQDEPSVVADGEQSPGPGASPTPATSPTPSESPTPATSPTTADGPSPTPMPSPTAGTGGTASPTPGPRRTSKEPSTPASAEAKRAPAPPPAVPAPAAPAPAAPAPAAPAPAAPAPAAPAPAAPAPATEQVFAVAHAENGQSYAAVYVKRDGEWVALAEAIGNDAPKITP